MGGVNGGTSALDAIDGSSIDAAFDATVMAGGGGDVGIEGVATTGRGSAVGYVYEGGATGGAYDGDGAAGVGVGATGFGDGGAAATAGC